MNAASPPQTGIDAARLIDEHQAGIWRYLRALGCDSSLADDLTQDAFLALLRQPFEERSPAATAVYLRRTAYNLFISHHRKHGRMLAMENIEEVDQNWTSWAGDDHGESLLAALGQCLQTLTERARRAVELRYRDRASRQHIAAELEMTEHGARNLLQRTKQKLRGCIEAKLK